MVSGDGPSHILTSGHFPWWRDVVMRFFYFRYFSWNSVPSALDNRWLKKNQKLEKILGTFFVFTRFTGCKFVVCVVDSVEKNGRQCHLDTGDKIWSSPVSVTPAKTNDTRFESGMVEPDHTRDDRRDLVKNRPLTSATVEIQTWSKKKIWSVWFMTHIYEVQVLEVFLNLIQKLRTNFDEKRQYLP